MTHNTDRARAILFEARAQLGSDRHVDAKVFACQQRLNRPLRVALVGSSKSGKSTLLSALVGDDIAQAVSAESSRVTTWFSHSRIPRIDVIFDDGRRTELPVDRQSASLECFLAGESVDRIERLHVQWPSAFLANYTLIDTPGLPADSGMVSERTLARLTQADVIIYLTADVSPHDMQFVKSLQQQIVGSTGILGVIACSLQRDTAPAISGVNFQPVSGLLALRGRTLRPSEFSTLTQLAALPASIAASALVSEARFTADGIPIPVAERTKLLSSFGLPGVRTAVSILKDGAADAAALAAELVRRSGVDELQQTLQSQFGERHEQLAVHSAMQSLRHVLERHATAHSMYLLSDVDQLLSEDHSFRELEELTVLRSGQLNVTEWQRHALEQALGGLGVSSRARLGLEPDADDSHLVEVAHSAARYWRVQLENPVLDTKRERAFATAARSCEAILAERALVHF